MLKRTKGRLLLTLLVVTGFAGTINDTSLSKQERKFAINQLKDTKIDLLKSIRGLSEEQLSFKQSPDQWSIKERFYHLVQAESGFWDMLEASMKKPATPEKRSELKISDNYLLKLTTDTPDQAGIRQLFPPARASWKSMGEAITAFKSARAQHLRYVKITTEDLRNHVAQMPFGALDCYQICLMIAAHSNRHTQQLNEVKADPGFPKE